MTTATAMTTTPTTMIAVMTFKLFCSRPLSLRSFGHVPMCISTWCSADGWETRYESESFERISCATMAGCCRLLCAQTPWHLQDFRTYEEHMQLCFSQREVGTAKDNHILWFSTNLMWDPSTCTHSSQRQKPEGSSSLHQERILRNTSWSASCWTDSSLWHCRSYQLHHVENAMWECHYRLVHRLEHNYKWLSIWRRKRNGTQLICGVQVFPPWLWLWDIVIDGRLCSLWILTTKKDIRKPIFFDAVLNRL